jgi:hypothetical protein
VPLPIDDPAPSTCKARGVPDVRWAVTIWHPKGDWYSGVPHEYVEQAVLAASAPPAGASVVFKAGTPREIADAAAQHALVCGALGASVSEMPWPLGSDLASGAQPGA